MGTTINLTSLICGKSLKLRHPLSRRWRSRVAPAARSGPRRHPSSGKTATKWGKRAPKSGMLKSQSGKASLFFAGGAISSISRRRQPDLSSVRSPRHRQTRLESCRWNELRLEIWGIGNNWRAITLFATMWQTLLDIGSWKGDRLPFGVGSSRETELLTHSTRLSRQKRRQTAKRADFVSARVNLQRKEHLDNTVVQLRKSSFLIKKHSIFYFLKFGQINTVCWVILSPKLDCFTIYETFLSHLWSGGSTCVWDIDIEKEMQS